MRSSLSWKLSIILCSFCLSTRAQVSPDLLERFISTYRSTVNANSDYIDQAKAFYVKTKYTTAWILKENSANCDILLKQLASCVARGLRTDDYNPTYPETFRNGSLHLKDAKDSMSAEFNITCIALHFYNDLAYGNQAPSFGYKGLDYTPGCYDIPSLLADRSLKNNLALMIPSLAHSLSEVAALEKKLEWMTRVMAAKDFNEVIIIDKQVKSSNKPLVTKLYQLGIIDNDVTGIADTLLMKKLQEAQRQFGLLPDGIMRSTIMETLNMSLSSRVEQLSLALNYYRWLNCLVQTQSAIVVNIPAAYLKLYREDKVIIEMKMVVGKRSTPTPTLTSKVEKVILYPYWHVPHSIATKELLPRIKRNPGYINAGNYQVLNSNGKVVDPYRVNWKALSPAHFPYVIRQSTGCDNALGLMKLDFYNPFGVYLHDTPDKNAFMLNARFLSHGCMRMEKPMEMAHLILPFNAIAIDTLEEKGCLLNQSPVIVPANIQMPVIAWYNPAGVDATGRVLFYPDIYNKFSWMRKK